MLPSVSYSSACTAGSASRLRVLHAPVDERHDAQTVRGPDGFVASLEEVQHEALDALGPSRLGNGGVPRRREPHRVEDDQTDDDDEGGGRGGHRAPIAPYVLAQPVSQRVRPGLQRLAGEVVIDI